MGRLHSPAPRADSCSWKRVGKLRNNERSPPRPASQSLASGGSQLGPVTRVRDTPPSRAASVRAHCPWQASPDCARDSPEPRSQEARTRPRSAGHRLGRTAMAASGRAGRGAPRAGRRLSAPQPRAPAPGALGAHASGLRCLRAAGYGAHTARGSPGHHKRSNAAGAERSSSRAAHGASSRAEPAAGERAGGRRKTRTGVSEQGGGRAGRGKKGGAGPPRAVRSGHRQLRGSLPAVRSAPPGRDWGGERGGLPPPLKVSRDPARSLKPGVDRLSDSGSPGPPGLCTGGSGGAQSCSDDRAAPACRERPGAGVPWAGSTAVLFLHPTPLPPPGCAPRPSARRGTPPARGLGRGLRESAQIPGQPAEVPWQARLGATPSPKHVGWWIPRYPRFP